MIKPPGGTPQYIGCASVRIMDGFVNVF